MAEPSNLPSFPGLIHRVGAFLLDTLLLATVFAVIALVLPHPVRALQGWGRYLGGLVAVFYFALGNSRVAGGRTLGKRFFSLRLRRVDGRDVSFGSSLLRSAVLFIPLVLNGATIPLILARFPGIGFVFMPIVAGIPLATFYLMLFARPARRCLHDIATGTVVVLNEASDVSSPRLSRGHLIAVGLLIIAASVVPNLAIDTVWRGHQSVMNLVADIDTIPTVWSPRVSRTTTTVRSSGEEPSTVQSLDITVSSSGDQANFANLSQTMVRKALMFPGAATGAMDLVVRVDYRFDLFLFGWTESKHRAERVQTWRFELGLE